MEEIKELSQINFGVASTEDILKKSVYEVLYSKYTEKKSNTVYDHRGGAIFNKKCETCKEYEQLCPGHFGHIKLNAVIVNPIFFNHVLNILKIVCFACSKLILTRQHLEFSNITKFEGERRISEIINKVKKCVKCFHCSRPKREYKIKKDPFLNIICYDNSVEITDQEIFEIFSDIDNETLDNLKTTHPKNYCLEVFPVIPPCCRPYEFVGNTIKEDDLTKQLVEIVKCNNSIPTATDKYTVINNLKFKIETYCRNPKKPRNISSDPVINGIHERLTGKDGQLRENLMGKRTGMSARTVIGPGVNLKVDEVGVPEFIAKTITFPINVYKSNIEDIKKLIDQGIVEKIKRNGNILRIDLQIYDEILKFLKHGDVILRHGEKITVIDTKFKLLETDRIFRDSKEITPEIMPKLKPVDIRPGDIAQRRILNGDWVLMNRQPTLWKGSMLAFKTVISKHSKTFTFNLAVCKSFNADFDGDEQNAHFPQSVESTIELQSLSSPAQCLLNNSNGNPSIVILQDALLGAYLMSEEKSMIVTKANYNDIIMCLSRPFFYYMKRQEEIRNTLKELKIYKGEHSMRTGRSLLSLIIPKDFNIDNDDLKIKDGVIYHGVLTKKYLGSTKSSFIFLFKMEFGISCCVDFINDVQFLTNKWLLFNSFSINIGDCFQNNFTESLIDEKLQEADFISKNFLNKNLAEAKINVSLSNAKDIGMKIAENSTNNFVKMIKSGSKGDFFNLGQVKGLLGQQIINGKRITYQLDNGTRSLIHYPKKLNLRQNFESNGFITDSFFKGINPLGFFFHGMSGRQGVCDTAMTTSTSGYITRRLVKLTEDIKLQNDGTVSDTNGNIYSYIYGDLGMTPENKSLNIDKLITKINKDCCI